MNGTPIMKCLLKGFENKGRMRRPANTPADNAPGKCVDDEGELDKTLPSGDIGEIRNPEPRIARV